MKEMVEMMLLMEIGTRLEATDFFQNKELANGDKEKLEAVALEAEKVVFEVANEAIKSDEDVKASSDDAEEEKELIEEKYEIIKGLVEHQYKFLDIPTPFEKGLTLDEVIKRNA